MGKNVAAWRTLRHRDGVKQKPFEFQAIFSRLQLELAATKMRCADVVAKAHRTREHVQRCRAQRNGSAWSPDRRPTFVSDRSVRVH